MISMYAQSRDKKLLHEAQQMLEDARTKIEIVRMQILRVKQAGKQQDEQSTNQSEVRLRPELTNHRPLAKHSNQSG